MLLNSFVKIVFCVPFLLSQSVGYCYPFGPEPEEIADSPPFFAGLIILACTLATIFYLYCVICEHTKIENPGWTATGITFGMVALEGYFFKTNGNVPVSLIIAGFYSMYKIYTYKCK